MKVDGRGKHKQDPKIAMVDEIELEIAIFKRSFRDYVPEAFEVAESGDAYAAGVRAGLYKPRYSHGWHIDAVAEHLQAVTDRQIRYLLINIPPGTMKSVETCILWPTWMWARDEATAAHRFMFSSYAEDFTKRDTRRSKSLMQSEWYRARFPHVVLKETPDTMIEHHNTLGGERHGASTNSGVTGKHVHGIVEDDPLKAQDAQSERAREEAWFYRTQVLGSRLLPEAGWRVLIMQRLHEADPSGRILDKANEVDGVEYTHLNLPMEFEHKRKCVTYVKRPVVQPNGVTELVREKLFEDPRTEEGELLWPLRMGAKFVAEKKSPTTGLGAYGYAGQYQQRPAPAEGSIIKREWLRYYKHADIAKQIPSMQQEQSWDLVFDGDGQGSFVVGQVWGRLGVNHYLLYQYRERVNFPDTCRAFVMVSQRWPRAVRKRVEKKANGAALIATLRDKIPGVTPWPPKGTRLVSKAARMEAVSPIFEAGNVWAPHPDEQPWIESWIEEVVGMTSIGPSTANDDQADGTTQYLADKGFKVKSAGMRINLDIGTKTAGRFEGDERGGLGIDIRGGGPLM